MTRIVKILAICATAFVSLLAAVAAAQSAPVALVEIAAFDTGTLKGAPSRLAWSSDGTSLYLEAIKTDSWGEVKATTRFLVSLHDRSVKRVDEQPDWASQYWSWKSNPRSPASPSTEITVEKEGKASSGAAVATAGDPGRSGSAAIEDMTWGRQTSAIVVLTWQGATIGRWMNQPVVPGSNFSWAPAPRVALAYAPLDGTPIVVVDNGGGKQTIAGSKAATLPAWSPDGGKIAWLEKRDRKHIVLVVSDAPGR